MNKKILIMGGIFIVAVGIYLFTVLVLMKPEEGTSENEPYIQSDILRYVQITKDVPRDKPYTETFSNNALTLGLFDDDVVSFFLPSANSLSNTYEDSSTGNIQKNYTNYNFVWYSLDNGDLEWEIHFKNSVPTNEISFDVDFGDYEFLYQPPLDEEIKIKGISCNATDCTNISSGESFTHRPENVVDSYAVYHSSKKHNEYKTGKAFHIYRIKLIRPSVGGIGSQQEEIWCEQNILNDVYTLSCPTITNFQSGDVLDPTIGYSTYGSSGAWYGYPHPLGVIYQPYTASAGDTVTQIHFYGNAQSGRNGPFGIYDYSGGVPVNLLIDAGILTSPLGGVNEHTTDSFSQALSAGTTYVIVFARNTGSDLGKYYDSGSAGDDDNHDASSSTLPDPYSSAGGYINARWSVWADVTSGGGGGDCWITESGKLAVPPSCKYHTNSGGAFN